MQNTNASAAGFSSGAGGGRGHENSYTDATCITKISAAAGHWRKMAAKAMLQDATLHFLQPQGKWYQEHLALMVEALMAVAAHKAAEEDIMAGVEASNPKLQYWWREGSGGPTILMNSSSSALFIVSGGGGAGGSWLLHS